MDILKLKLVDAVEARSAEAVTDVESIIKGDLNQLIVLNTMQWIRLRLNGKNPHNNPVKKILEDIKSATYKWLEARDGVVTEESRRSVERIFATIYSM